MAEWIQSHDWLLWWLVALSIVTFVASLVVIPMLIVRMPADYFVSKSPLPESWRGRHPVIRWTVRVLKNALGVVLVVAGLLMLVWPGQGVLTLVIGIALLDVPGKRRVEIWLIRKDAVHRAINWIRKRAGRQPLELPAPKQE